MFVLLAFEQFNNCFRLDGLSLLVPTEDLICLDQTAGVFSQPDVQGVEVLPAFRTLCGKTHLTQVLCHRSVSNDGGTSDLGIPKIPGGSATASFLLQYPEY